MLRSQLTVVIHVAVVALISAASQLADQSGQPIKEYCERDIFRAECRARDEVILITHARYGRMRDGGRCITNTYGGIGCFTDVRMLLESLCSARRQCEVTVATLVPDHSQPCPTDFRGYLEAAFECVKVLSTVDAQQHCTGSSGPTLVQLHDEAPTSGFLASVVTEETGCGSVDSPWKLVAPSGRRLKIYLIDYSTAGNQIQHHQQQQKQRPRVCQVYAVLREETNSPGGGQTICSETVPDPDSVSTPADSRHPRLVYTSITGAIEIRLVVGGTRHKHQQQQQQHPQQSSPQHPQLSPARFLLKYEVFGCADPLPPANGGMQRTDNDVIMWCNDTLTSSTTPQRKEQWHLRCEGNEWVGTQKQCNSDGTVVANAGNTFSFEMFNNLQGISVMVILIIALTIGVTMAAIGAVYLRRLRQRREAMYQRQVVLAHPDQYEYNYRLQHGGPGPGLQPQSIEPQSGAKLVDPHSNFLQQQQFATTPITPHGVHVSIPAYEASENDYYKSWQTTQRLQQHQQQPMRPLPSSLPFAHAPQQLPAMTSYGDSAMIGGGQHDNDRESIDHVYESPKFIRRDFPTFSKS